MNILSISVDEDMHRRWPSVEEFKQWGKRGCEDEARTIAIYLGRHLYATGTQRSAK
jgi:hypothetical protein